MLESLALHFSDWQLGNNPGFVVRKLLMQVEEALSLIRCRDVRSSINVECRASLEKSLSKG